MKVVYIAGPFTASDSWRRERNVRRAEELGFIVAGAGAMPLIPHANTRYFDGTMSAQFWYEGTLELLRRCDAVAVCEGYEESKGTKAEIAEAMERGLPVFLPGERGALARWIDGGRK